MIESLLLITAVKPTGRGISFIEQTEKNTER